MQRVTTDPTSPLMLGATPTSSRTRASAWRVWGTRLPRRRVRRGVMRARGRLDRGDTTPQGIAIDALNVYWTDTGAGGQVRECALTGCDGGPTTLATNLASPNAVLSVENNVYWTNYGAFTLMECARSADAVKRPRRSRACRPPATPSADSHRTASLCFSRTAATARCTPVPADRVQCPGKQPLPTIRTTLGVSKRSTPPTFTGSTTTPRARS